MLRTDYKTLEEMVAELGAATVVAKINQFHLERNKRMEFGKAYQKRQREELKLLRAALEDRKQVA